MYKSYLFWIYVTNDKFHNTSLRSGDCVVWSSVPPHPVAVRRWFSGMDFVGRQTVPTDEGKSEAELK